MISHGLALRLITELESQSFSNHSERLMKSAKSFSFAILLNILHTAQCLGTIGCHLLSSLVQPI
jgi:hypothetical protein